MACCRASERGHAPARAFVDVLMGADVAQAARVRVALLLACPRQRPGHPLFRVDVLDKGQPAQLLLHHDVDSLCQQERAIDPQTGTWTACNDCRSGAPITEMVKKVPLASAAVMEKAHLDMLLSIKVDLDQRKVCWEPRSCILALYEPPLLGVPHSG